MGSSRAIGPRLISGSPQSLQAGAGLVAVVKWCGAPHPGAVRWLPS